MCADHQRPPSTSEPRLLDRVRNRLRTRHYSPRTEKAYVSWIRRFILFHDRRHPDQMGEAAVTAFLTHLATQHGVAASTQNQALAALLFLYAQVLRRDLDTLDPPRHARRPTRVPVVLTRPEVAAVLGRMHGPSRLVATLLYGAGLRLLESLRLRRKDIDFERREVLIRDPEGRHDRRSLLPDSLAEPLHEHIRTAKRLHERDLSEGGDAWRCPPPCPARCQRRSFHG